MKSSKNTSPNTQSLPPAENPIDDALSGSTVLGNEDSIPWSNFFYKVWWNIRRLFTNPFKEKKKELRLLDQVGIILSEGDAEKMAETCEKYIALHRIVENTRARRRLERWVTRLIVGYLLIVFLLVLSNSFSTWLANKSLPYVSMDSGIVIALLTTTTVNIVALGIILVRGLFHEHENSDMNREIPSANK